MIRVVISGACWATAYNILWGLAWVGFMRGQWVEAAEMAGQPMPWTPDFWAIWIPMTLPFGLAVAAYLLGRRDTEHLRRDAISAGLVVWVPGTIGMAFGAALTARIIVLDSVVNLVAVLVPSLLLAELLRRRPISTRETEALVSAS